MLQRRRQMLFSQTRNNPFVVLFENSSDDEERSGAGRSRNGIDQQDRLHCVELCLLLMLLARQLFKDCYISFPRVELQVGIVGIQAKRLLQESPARLFSSVPFRQK